MENEIIVAIIAGLSGVLVAIITGIFSVITKKTKGKNEQKIQGNANIQAGNDIEISGGVTINAKTNNNRKQ